MRFLAAGLVAGVAIFSMASLSTQVAGAATDTVTNCSGSGPGSLPMVVGGAGSGDTITFSVSCPPASPIVLSSTIDISQDLTVDGPGSTTLAVSGDNAVGVFEVSSDVTATISGVTIEDGNAGVRGFGGGIYNSGGTVSLTNSTVSGNSAPEGGGGIYDAGTLTVTDSTLSDNTVSAEGMGGGGIYSSGTTTVTNSTLSSNSASTTISAIGGGILNFGTLTVTESTLSKNNATFGGGIYNGATMTVTNSTVSTNTAPDNGGGIYTQQGSTSTVTNSTLSANNSAEDAGADISLEGGMVTIANSTVSDNTSDDYGIGIYNGGGTLSVTNSTLVSNNSGPAIYLYPGNAAAVQASILANVSGSGDACYGTVTDNGYNIDDDGSCGLTATGSISGSTTLNNTLGPLANNGGTTETIALLPGSPAIGVVPAADCPPTDQRGVTRPNPCDIGAYQTGGSTTPTPTIAKVKPAKGKPGKKVTIKGTNLSGATAVHFNGVLATIKTDTASEITTTVPMGAATGPISVTTPGGTVVSTKSFKVI